MNETNHVLEDQLLQESRGFEEIAKFFAMLEIAAEAACAIIITYLAIVPDGHGSTWMILIPLALLLSRYYLALVRRSPHERSRRLRAALMRSAGGQPLTMSPSSSAGAKVARSIGSRLPDATYSAFFSMSKAATAPNPLQYVYAYSCFYSQRVQKATRVLLLALSAATGALILLGIALLFARAIGQPWSKVLYEVLMTVLIAYAGFGLLSKLNAYDENADELAELSRHLEACPPNDRARIAELAAAYDALRLSGPPAPTFVYFFQRKYVETSWRLKAMEKTSPGVSADLALKN